MDKRTELRTQAAIAIVNHAAAVLAYETKSGICGGRPGHYQRTEKALAFIESVVDEAKTGKTFEERNAEDCAKYGIGATFNANSGPALTLARTQ